MKRRTTAMGYDDEYERKVEFDMTWKEPSKSGGREIKARAKSPPMDIPRGKSPPMEPSRGKSQTELSRAKSPPAGKENSKQREQREIKEMAREGIEQKEIKEMRAKDVNENIKQREEWEIKQGRPSTISVPGLSARISHGPPLMGLHGPPPMSLLHGYKSSQNPGQPKSILKRTDVFLPQHSQAASSQQPHTQQTYYQQSQSGGISLVNVNTDQPESFVTKKSRQPIDRQKGSPLKLLM